MKIKERYLAPLIERDLREKMVFVGGPRQVGKTTLALRFLAGEGKRSSGYLNWDLTSDRELIRKGLFPANQSLIVLDEVHKFNRWRQLLKGHYDKFFPERNFLVTGSARLDYYRRGGDSLQGRYHYWRLHPYSVGELGSDAIKDLFQFGGFPEPFEKGEKVFWQRWNRERLDRVVRDDLRELEGVKDLSLIDLLIDALPARVGSLLSLNSLAEDLEVSLRSVDRWIRILEALYLCFRIAPYGAPRIKAIKKSKKLYLWDWGGLDEPGARFENLVAAQLLKYCHYIEDSEGLKMELRYLQDANQREIDFVVLKNRSPIFAVECKHGEKSISPAIKYYRGRTEIAEFYQVHMGAKDYGNSKSEGRVLPFVRFCEELGMP